MESSVLKSALTLASQGIACFPCARSKAPTKPKERGGQGYKDATKDPAVLRDLWNEFPGDLIGVPTGAINGFDVLDIDSKHHAAREWWAENRKRISATRVHRTRSGGLHLLFKHTPGIRCSASKIAPGVDIRTTGGYAIWWPAAGFPILASDAPIADLPAWLHSLLIPPAEAPMRARLATIPSNRRVLQGVIRVVATANEGERNAILFWGACRAGEMVTDGSLTEDDAVALLVEAASRTGLSRTEALRTARSGLRASRR
jgi:hypothetical protein